MKLNEVGEQIGKAPITAMAAVLALLIYVLLVWWHVSIALQAEVPMEAFKDVLLWSIPILLGILEKYGVLNAAK